MFAWISQSLHKDLGKISGILMGLSAWCGDTGRTSLHSKEASRPENAARSFMMDSMTCHGGREEVVPLSLLACASKV